MKKSAILASSLGNIIEWYDFGLFAAFSQQFANLFFPNDELRIGIIKIFAIFAVGFICRPIGAILFGHFGDRIGRAKTLRATILLISIPTLLIGFLPTYETAGILSPLLLVLLRLIQGISLGGEYTGNIIYLVESAPDNRRALVASAATVAANIGILLATSLVLLLEKLFPTDMLNTFGWRIPFIFGAIISLVIFYLRKSFIETPVFETIRKKHHIAAKPIKELFKYNTKQILFIMSLVSLGAVFYYLCFIYLQDYLATYSAIPKTTLLSLFTVCMSSMIFLVPLGGFICDKIGRRKSFLLVSGGVLLFSVIGFHLLLSHSVYLTAISMMIFTLLSSLEQATTGVTVVEQFPVHLRYSGVSFGYNLTQALIGGTSPLFAASLITFFNNIYIPAYYLMMMASITFISAFFFLKKSLSAE